jgi:hypothetical protein
MARPVLVRGHFQEVELLLAHRATPDHRARALSAVIAMHRVAPALRRPEVAMGLATLLGTRDASPDRLAGQLERRLRDRSLVAVERRMRRVIVEVEEVEALGPLVDEGEWIEIALVDQDGAPVPDQPYEIRCADGRVRSGTLDRNGRAREDGITPGTCRVAFPRLDASLWRAA